MAKILDTVAAVERYVLRRSEDHQVDPALPDEIDAFHAVVLEPESWSRAKAFIVDATEPAFLTGRIAEVVNAACGLRVRVLLPEPFNSESPKACSRCLSEMGLKGA